MKGKRFLTSVLTASMLLSTLAMTAAASEGSDLTFPLEETASFTMFAIMNGENELSNNAAFNYSEERMNVKFDVQSVMGADMKDKRGIILASGEYPDVFFKAGLKEADLEKYGAQQKILIPLENLLRQYAPNICALLDERDGWDYVTSSDGHVYSIPGITAPERKPGNAFWFNKKWLDNLGLEEPKNLDELYNALKAFKDQDANGNGDPNDEIPMTCSTSTKPDLLLPYFGICYDYDKKCALVDGEFTYIPTSEVQKEFIAFIAKLYQEGLLDKNAFTQAAEQQGAIGQSGDVLGSFFESGAFLTVGRDNDDDYILLSPFVDGTYPINAGIYPGAMAITDKCPTPEIVVAWADQFYSEEGGILSWMGVEGKSWRKSDDGGWEWIVGEGLGDDIAAVRAAGAIQGASNHPALQPDYWWKISEAVDPDEAYLNKESAKVIAMGSIPLPVMLFSDEDTQTMATLKADLDVYIDQYLVQVATGELDLESSWDEYLSTMDAMGATQLADIYKASYEKAIAE